MLFIKNGVIKTMVGDDIQDGQILIVDGKIKAIGNSLEIPKEAEVIDASVLMVMKQQIQSHLICVP